MRLLDTNIHYYGIDIAIQQTAPNLIQYDFPRGSDPGSGDKKVDMIVAQGVLRVSGETVDVRKFEEIAHLLKDDGVFILSYVNFGPSRNTDIYWPYSNVQSFNNLREGAPLL